MKKLILITFTVVALMGMLMSSIMAHKTGNERRTVAQCKALAKKGKRKACIACVKRPKPHHFHPKYAAGKRCRPNDGKP